MNDEHYDETGYQNMLSAYAELDQARAEYAAKWPCHCKRCHGWGYTEWREYGQVFTEPCDDCAMVGYCPRCGNEAQLVKEQNDPRLGLGICDHCNFELGADEGMRSYT
jgi:hypothetical protein